MGATHGGAGTAVPTASACGTAWLLVLLSGAPAAVAQPAPAPPVPDPVASSAEQGQTSLDETFGWSARLQQIRDQRRRGLRDTRVEVALRTMYFDRTPFDGPESEAWAIGGSLGLKTGFFHDRVALGATAYTSQRILGDPDKDGALLLGSGQDGYTVLGEIYADVRLPGDVSLQIGRKGFDTPYINRNDSRMTPNTFQAAAFRGHAELGGRGAVLSFGGGYFDEIKERNADRFVSMAQAAGASVDRGVFVIGGRYSQGAFSLGAIDYYSADVINIAYAEADYAIPLPADLRLKMSLQYADQRSTGDDALLGAAFSAHQLGVKAELPWGPALLTAAFTRAGGDTDMQSPWSGYPGYTSVQVEDFNRDGESALLLRAAYRIPIVSGLSAYALWVHGTTPDAPGQYRRDEYDVNLQWAPPEGILKGLSLRLRYALVEQHGGDGDPLQDLRVICNYSIGFNPLSGLFGPAGSPP